MNLAELEKKLIAAARQNPPSDRVPYAFEKRVMAHLKAMSHMDDWALWARALWRSAAACLAVVCLLSAVTLFTPDSTRPAHASYDLSIDFEKTMLASVDQDADYSR
jgi:hypothetical protein